MIAVGRSVSSGSPPLITLDALAAAAATAVDNLVVFDQVDSTHAVALRLIEQMDVEGFGLRPTAILAGRQTRGAGRGRRSWASPRGGVYLSWLVSGLAAEQIAGLPMIAAAAIHGAVAELGIGGAELKWPNDLLVAGRKLAGIIVHARHGETTWATIGLGVNVTVSPPLDAQDRPATSLSDLLPDRDLAGAAVRLAAAYLSRLGDGLGSPADAIAHWRSALVHRPGDHLQVRLGSGEALQGSYVGVTAEGHLRLDTGREVRTLTGGDVVEGPADPA